MTSKERIRAAFAHKDTDRVPTNMHCVDTAWENMRKYLNVQTDEEVMEHFDIDIRILELPPYIGPAVEPFQNEKGETVLTHPFGYQYINKWNGVEYNWHIISHPFAAVQSMEDLERFDGWFNPDHYDYSAVTDFVRRYPDKAIRIGWPGPYQVFSLLYNTEEFYVNMYEEPELLKAMLDRYCESCYQIYDRMFEAGNGQIDFLYVCDDYGTQLDSLFSPKMWDEFFSENTRKFVDLAHRHGAYYMQHSCGAIRRILPNLVACGVDGLDPIQKVAGMEVEALKRDFGDKLCFHGGVDTQGVLPFGTPEEVYEETTRIIRALYKDGGYILCGSQEFEGDVPPENIVALYEAAKQFRK